MSVRLAPLSEELSSDPAQRDGADDKAVRKASKRYTSCLEPNITEAPEIICVLKVQKTQYLAIQYIFRSTPCKTTNKLSLALGQDLRKA